MHQELALEEYPKFSSLHLLQIKCEVFGAPFESAEPLPRLNYLPSSSGISGEEPFGIVAVGWSPEGLRIQVEFDRPFKEGTKDFIEVWIDTRDVKDAGFATRFCHQFCAYARSKEKEPAKEVSQFRTEQAHIPCDPKLLSVVRRAPNLMELKIPKEALCGYDPDEFDRLGFTYRLHREEGNKQHFAMDGSHLSFEQFPSLWASLTLV